MANGGSSEPWSLGAVEIARYQLARWRLRFTRLGREITRFSHWLESELSDELLCEDWLESELPNELLL